MLADEHQHVERIQADRVGRNGMEIKFDGERQENGADRIRWAKGVEAELSRELTHRGVAESCDREDKLPLPFERHDKIVHAQVERSTGAMKHRLNNEIRSFLFRRHRRQKEMERFLAVRNGHRTSANPGTRRGRRQSSVPIPPRARPKTSIRGRGRSRTVRRTGSLPVRGSALTRACRPFWAVTFRAQCRGQPHATGRRLPGEVRPRQTIRTHAAI